MNLKERMEEGNACAYCGGPMPHAKTGRPRRFCSEICRGNYWKIHREELKKNPKATYTMMCAYCGEVFESYGNKTRKYCCHDHYIRSRFGEKETCQF